MEILTKREVQKRVLKDGKPLDLNLFEWNEETRTFDSPIDGLVLDFKGIDNVEFICWVECSFETGNNCIFNTKSKCTFKTGDSCSFYTWSNCTFNTENNCSFNTWADCKFKAGNNCTVNRRDTNETIHLKPSIEIILCPYKKEGYMYKKDDKYIYSKDDIEIVGI